MTSALNPVALVRSGLVLCYSLLMVLLGPVLQVVSQFNPKLGAQLKDRPTLSLAAELAKPRMLRRRCVVFYCSSAGEYEQARPLIERFMRASDVFVHVFFFSRSGYDFARARGEAVSYSLSPALDSVWHWGNLFSALRPDLAVVVRHELWPGFLETARHFGRVYLIDASRSVGEASSLAKRLVRGQLLRYFDRIFTVGEDDARFFTATYGLTRDSVVVTGDTKYDRVIERARAKAEGLSELTLQLGGGEAAKRLVLGSAHRPDVDLWLDAWQQLGADVSDWQVVIAPHHVDAETISWITERCRARGYAPTLFSSLSQSPVHAGRPQIMIVDVMGRLAEIYAAAAMAYVGGALHHQVHNVLEPACHGAAVAFGPRHETSQEALGLVAAGLATICGDPASFAAWWRQLHGADASHRARVVAEVERWAGASDRILSDVEAQIRSPGLPALG